MDDATAITAIIVSGVVGPSLAALWARGLATSQDRRNRESADLKELRILLDDAVAGFDAVIRRYQEFSEAWYSREAQPNADTRAAMEDAYVPLGRAAIALFEMHSRFDARLGPDHPLSEGFEKLRDQAFQLMSGPGGVAAAFDKFTKEQRDAVHELSVAQLSVFVGNRRDWIVASLPAAGLRVPDLDRQTVAVSGKQQGVARTDPAPPS